MKEDLDEIFDTLKRIMKNYSPPFSIQKPSKALKKKRSYENIKNNLKVSSATIATAEKNIDSKGIKLALKKLEAEEWANVWSEKIKKLKLIN